MRWKDEVSLTVSPGVCSGWTDHEREIRFCYCLALWGQHRKKFAVITIGKQIYWFVSFSLLINNNKNVLVLWVSLVSHLVPKSPFFHLRSLSKIKTFLSKSSLEVVIHACITSRLDYCNSLYFGISNSQISQLQVVQNSAIIFLKGCKSLIMPLPSCDHCIGCQFIIELSLKSCYLSINHLTIKLRLICLIYSSPLLLSGEGTKIRGQTSPPDP